MGQYRGVVMGSNKGARRINERFMEAYIDFDEILCERFNIEKDGAHFYLVKMKEAVLEAREAIPEYDITYDRLKAIRNRYLALKQGGAVIDDFQGKDEDVVWMQVFEEKLDADADPLSKYSRMTFNYRQKGFWERLIEVFRR